MRERERARILFHQLDINQRGQGEKQEQPFLCKGARRSRGSHGLGGAKGPICWIDGWLISGGDGLRLDALGFVVSSRLYFDMGGVSCPMVLFIVTTVIANRARASVLHLLDVSHHSVFAVVEPSNFHSWYVTHSQTKIWLLTL